MGLEFVGIHALRECLDDFKSALRAAEIAAKSDGIRGAWRAALDDLDHSKFCREQVILSERMDGPCLKGGKHTIDLGDDYDRCSKCGRVWS